jgi:hypothetical protein
MAVILFRLFQVRGEMLCSIATLYKHGTVRKQLPASTAFCEEKASSPFIRPRFQSI